MWLKRSRQQFALLPFYEKRCYGTDPYSSGFGPRLEYSYLISPVWQVSQVLEYQKMAYDKREYQFLRGDNRYASTTFSYAWSPEFLIYFGGDIAEQNTKARSETNRRYSIRAGQEVDLS